jgi:outer membrane receptor protein involved in Fe transport
LTTHQVECDRPTLGGEVLQAGEGHGDYREDAIFGNADYHLTPTFDVALGGRYSSNKQSSSSASTGVFGGGGVLQENPTLREKVFTYSGDVRWHLNPESMLYSRVATGYQPGGTNPVLPGIPPTYKSSRTTNYEVGFKSSLLDHHLTAELAVYHINWQDLFTTVFVYPFGSYTTNAGTAHSDGVEWQLTYTPTPGLTLGATGTYDHAFLSELSPYALIPAKTGDRLPFIPLWQGAITANYERHISGDYSAFIGVNAHFSGSRYSFFLDPRPVMPSYGMVDLRTGMESKKYSLTLYVKNVGNVIPVLSTAPSNPNDPLGPQAASVLRPRTLGVTLAAKF